MNYRGKVLTISPTGNGQANDYICSAHYADHVEIVPVVPGTEGLAFPPIPLSGPGIVGMVYDSRDDAELIRRVKDRCALAVRGMEQGEVLFSHLFSPLVFNSTIRGVRENLTRLESLDGDQPTVVDCPTPSRDSYLALDHVFEELFNGTFAVVDEIQDPVFVAPVPKMPMIGEHFDYIGKLVFIEIPLAYDHGESGEYIVVQQSADSIYGMRTTCCHSGLEVVRIPFEESANRIAILDEYEDDGFIHEFIERLDDMDTENYKAIECDLAETVCRQLSRMLERKLLQRAKILNNPLSHPFKTTDGLFNTLGCTSGRMDAQTEDRPQCDKCCDCPA